MRNCTNCGTTVKLGQNQCHVCGVNTPYQKAQRVCINCGTPVAQQANTCFMCGHTIDVLPNRAIDFSTSWSGVIIGLLIIIALTYSFFQITPTASSELTVSPTLTVFVPPTNTATPTNTLTPTLTPTFSPTDTPTPSPLIHKIKTGEGLLAIATKYQITVEDLLAANKDVSEATILQVGQELIIPFRTVSDNGEQIDDRPTIEYTVKEGDTLSGIAFEYDTTITAIDLANPDINLDFLSVGQKIVVPLRPPTATPTPTVTPTPTFTPQPPFLTPKLLLPVNNTLIEGDDSSVLLSWTTAGLLSEDVFYVIHLKDDNNQLYTYWTNESTSYRLSTDERPPELTTYTWYVVVMEKIGVDSDGIFYGKPLSNPSAEYSFQWR